MILSDSKALKSSHWLTAEQVTAEDILGLSQSIYKDSVDLLSLTTELGTPTGSTPNLVLSGCRLEWSATLSSFLRAGTVLSFQGTYIDEDGEWGFVSSAGKIFGVVVPVDTLVTVAGGSGSDRYDLVEARPVRTFYRSKLRKFKDPITQQETTANINTRVEYGVEVHVVQGTPGAGVAPTATAGWVKLAEVFVPTSASSINQSNIKDARDSVDWTTQPSSTVRKIDYVQTELSTVTALGSSDEIAVRQSSRARKITFPNVSLAMGNAYRNYFLPMDAKPGMTLSYATTTTFTASKGIRLSDDGAIAIVAPSSMTKSISSAWAAGNGNGCMDTGSAPANGTLHVYAIGKDDGSWDYLCSNPAATTPGSPVMPSGWTRKRYVGSFVIVASALYPFLQDGDDFGVAEYTENTLVASNRTFALLTLVHAPFGVRTFVKLSVLIQAMASGAGIVQTMADGLNSAVVRTHQLFSSTTTTINSKDPEFEVGTDAQARIYYGTTGGVAASDVKNLYSHGWRDRRMAFTGME